MVSTQYPVFYSFRRCPYAIRARLALSVSREICIHREIDLRDRPEDLYLASPKGTVPVLVISKTQVIDESLDIMRWALNRNDPESWMRPSPEEYLSRRYLCKMSEDVLKCCDESFKYHLDRYKYSSRYDNADRRHHREEASEFLFRLDRMLSSGPFLLGNRVSFVDMATAPFVRQFAFADMSWFQSQSWRFLNGWLENFILSPRFQGVMKKIPVWSPGDEDLVQEWGF